MSSDNSREIRHQPYNWHEIIPHAGVTATEKYNAIKTACNEQRVCRIRFKDERIPRFIHPLGVCLTFGRGLVIVCCQEDSAKKQKPLSPEVSNLPIEDCDHIHITDRTFEVFSEFLESKNCDDWLFHVNPA